MSEATLHRRLSDERVRFEDLLIDVRMHHTMMLVQTTSWSIPHIAQACGYKSRARFAERFRARFGYLPSTVRCPRHHHGQAGRLSVAQDETATFNR
ncbi:helix-turn-helix domain-containing protein [Achromobacter marplatensis]|uniref:helix-turn-helix domain-containing protein n=1 Tax=Achromobacter marplatensis TaxID=470868 RepID=UPI0028EA943E|nr:helix-turn-helix domain-containing protein [Achromobacter marplatensis]